MRTLSVSISDIEYKKFGLTKEQISFSDFIELVSKELMRQNLNKSIELANKYGLSKMTMDEITNEVKIVRKDAKSRH
jgi:predicted CopG family antitoxin